MKRNLLLVLSVFAIALLLGSCDAAPENTTQIPQVDQANNLTTDLDPLPDPATPTPTSPIPAPPNVNPFPNDGGDQFGTSPGYNPGEWQIATPLYPNFDIVSAKMHFCNHPAVGEQWYVLVEVKNNGPYYFQWISFVVHHGGYTYYSYNWEMPWMSSGTECLLPENGHAVLAPGHSNFIYFPITPVQNEIVFDINIWMCTYNSIPDSCPYRQYILTQDIWAVMELPDFYLEEVTLCWVGPGPYYEVVNSIPADTEVELLGIGDVEGFFVVQEPKYNRPCWVQEQYAREVPEEIKNSLTMINSPILPGGVVSGRAYKDQDGNGSFGGSDVGLPAVQVNLAPGSCSSPGQATTTTTDGDGWYSFSNVEPGPYCLYMTRPNTCKKFSTADSHNLEIDWGSTTEKYFGFEGCR